MSLIPWFDPFTDMDEVFDEKNRKLAPHGSSGLIPPIDLYETDAQLVVESPMAGIDPKNIELSIEGGILTVKATSERKTEVDEKNYYRKEVRYGTVFRQIALPCAVQEDKVEAHYENGVLKVHLPKRLSSSTAIKVEIKK